MNNAPFRQGSRFLPAPAGASSSKAATAKTTEATASAPSAVTTATRKTAPAATVPVASGIHHHKIQPKGQAIFADMLLIGASAAAEEYY